MDHVWAPWRGAYFDQPRCGECIFCVMNEKRDDSKDYVIYRGEAVFASLNRFPYNVGHVMIAPYRHVENLEDLEDRETMEMLKVLKICIAAVRAVLKPDGFNVGANIGISAGAGVQHFHLHSVPRWIGDTNFMPILSDTKILSESGQDLE